ncbi:cysteine synthase A [Teredinibacter turnerae]|uniref:cysteine synthase A n=1 Tax=Teredinibacter turnerae TaxID=2426 RepID=UPI000372F695|nr:cysteine synthase A [Teredinibacter turnerae]
MSQRHESILSTIGNTPVIKINKLAPTNVNLYVKMEAFNPLSSVKDRLALGIIEAAEKSGALKPGQTVVEATSGNTGIGLAMVCAQKGYPLVVTMVETFSVERRKLMRFLGAKVVLTPAAQSGTGMVNKAKELAEKNGWFLARQFENEANPDMHSRTTAQEILRDFSDISLDYWVSGTGTGGTLKGVSRVLREKSPNTKIVMTEPANAAEVASGVSQERHSDGSPSARHPSFNPHPIQGWTPDFIPKLVEDAMNEKLFDLNVPVTGEQAMNCSKELAQKEGIFVGISSGATFAAALEIAKTAPDGSNILCMLPDTGERYLSTPLFGDIPADMNDEELDISKSTASCQLG